MLIPLRHFNPELLLFLIAPLIKKHALLFNLKWVTFDVSRPSKFPLPQRVNLHIYTFIYERNKNLRHDKTSS